MKKVILIMSFFSFFGLFSQAQEFNKLINLDRYAEANAALPAPAKGEKRVVFIGNLLLMDGLMHTLIFLNQIIM